jgi:hypothetical protein
LWWVFAAGVVAFPAVAGLARRQSVSLQVPMDLFELGFELPAVVFPLLAVGICVVAFSSEVAHGWIVYVRTRAGLGRFLAARAVGVAVATFAVFFLAVALWGAVAFGVGPAAGWAPDGSLPALSEADAALATQQAATFTRVAAAGAGVYVAVYAIWVGLWGALFALIAFLVLLLTGNRLLAFVAPVGLYWVENIVLANLGLEVFRSVSAVFPFSIEQQPVATALVPLAVWLALAGVLAGDLVRRRLEVASLL